MQLSNHSGTIVNFKHVSAVDAIFDRRQGDQTRQNTQIYHTLVIYLMGNRTEFCYTDKQKLIKDFETLNDWIRGNA